MTEEMPVSNTWTALRERKLVQWALAYLASAWVLLQVLDLIGHQFGWPDGLLRGITVALGIGFFATLVLAWYHGERGAQKVSGSELLILTLLLAVGGALLWRFVQGTRESTASPATTRARSDLVAIDKKSIAVLPFESLSEDKNNAYFAAGIQDEILTRLAKIGALKVISRTSTLQYASRPGHLPEIAKELGVANILEGSVQKAGDSVRINVQLIRADSDSHVWAETYDRKLTDMFAVESEVATTIAGSLQATLTGDEQRVLAIRPTASADAYEAYLRGLVLEAGSTNTDDWRKAAAEHAEAVRLDPQFALAWAHLAERRSMLYFNGIEVDENTPDAIKRAADTAMKLQPDLGEAWLAQGYYRYRVLRDFSGALRDFDEARKRLPNDAQVLTAFAYVQRRTGRWDEGLANMQQAVQLDPRNLSQLSALNGQFLGPMRRFAEGRVALQRALLIAPGNREFLAGMAASYLDEGRIAAAAKFIDPLPLDPKDQPVYRVKLRLLDWQRRFDEAIAARQLLLAEPSQPEIIDQMEDATDQGWDQLRVRHAAAARILFERVIRTITSSSADTIQFDKVGMQLILARAYAGINDRQAALDAAKQAVALARNDAAIAPKAEVVLAWVQTWFGDKDTALVALQSLQQVRNGITHGELQFDPNWDELRKDPRFQALLKKYAAASQR